MTPFVMTHSRLAAILGSLVATACSGSCPHTVVDRSTNISLSAQSACDLAVATNGTYGNTFGGKPCQDACKDPNANKCYIDQAYLAAFSQQNPGSTATTGAGSGGGGGSGAKCPQTSATLTCQVTHVEGAPDAKGRPMEGRRPAGLVDPECDLSRTGSYLASCAHLEAASIVAFRTLHDELARLAAPQELLVEVRRAEADEVRHTALMTRLAAKYGAGVAAVEVVPPGARGVLDIALENELEGIVRETFGAAVALAQAEHAADPEVRAALREIAEDECAHAALAFRVAAFLDRLLDDGQRALVRTARMSAIAELNGAVAAPAASLQHLLGLPGIEAQTALLLGMRRDLWNAAIAA